jgi:hypothetical protein
VQIVVIEAHRASEHFLLPYKAAHQLYGRLSENCERLARGV